MPAKKRDIAAESRESIASLTEFVKGYQGSQIKGLAVGLVPLAVAYIMRSGKRR